MSCSSPELDGGVFDTAEGIGRWVPESGDPEGVVDAFFVCYLQAKPARNSGVFVVLLMVHCD